MCELCRLQEAVTDKIDARGMLLPAATAAAYRRTAEDTDPLTASASSSILFYLLSRRTDVKVFAIKD